MKKRILSLLLVLLMLVGLFASCKRNKTDPDATGESTALAETTGDPNFIHPPSYEIDPNASVYSGTPDTSWYEEGKTEFTLTSADQLVGFHSLRSQTFDYEGITVKLACDVILNAGTAEEIKARGSENYAWTQLNSAYLFKGTFDGQGHIISGLYMQLSTSAVRGMFGGVGGNATIKDFTLINSYYGGPSATGKHSLGAIAAKIAGEGSNVTISGVNVQAILEEGSTEFTRVGGLIGMVSDALTLTLENCQFDGSVTVSGSYAGGMIGYVSGKETNVIMKNCANRGAIKAGTYAGGMTGLLVAATAEQTNCQNHGTITATQDAGDLNGRVSIMVDPDNGARPEAPEGTTALRVMSFNIQTSLPTSNGVLTDAAKNRIEAVKQEILFYEPDLLGLQEDNETWINSLCLEDYNVIQDATMSGERCAIYYKKGMHILDKGTVWLTATGTSEGVALVYEDLTTAGSQYYMTPEELAIIGVENTADLKEKKTTYVDQKTGKTVTLASGSYTLLTTRKMTWGVFDINGQAVIYVNTHLTHRSPNAEYSNDTFQKIRSLERLREFDLIQEQLAEIKKEFPNALVFMTGDWNDHVYSPIYEYVVTEHGYVCANFDTDQKYGINGSWNNAFNLDKQGDNYPSSSEGASGDYLDYCFIDPEIDTLKFRVGAGKAEINAVGGGIKTIYTSDHLPIIADICFKTEKTGSFIDPDYVDPSTDSTKYSGIPDTSWYDESKTEFTLTTADQVIGFFYLRNQNHSFKGKTVKMATDVVYVPGNTPEEVKAGSFNWYAINSNYLFEGTFDGQNHTFSGFRFVASGSCTRGMFGSMGEGATIKNLKLVNSYFCGPEVNKETFGLLVSRVRGANNTILNVTSENALYEHGEGTMGVVGGLIGRVEASASITIENCTVAGTMTMNANTCGGLIGDINNATASVTVKNCVNKINITAPDKVGGIAGHAATGATVTVEGFTNEGTLTATNGTNKNDQIGLVG